jgi:hypothetical protein
MQYTDVRSDVFRMSARHYVPLTPICMHNITATTSSARTSLTLYCPTLGEWYMSDDQEDIFCYRSSEYASAVQQHHSSKRAESQA